MLQNFALRAAQCARNCHAVQTCEQGNKYRANGVFKPNFSDLLPFFIRQTPNLSDTYSEWINRLQLIKSVGNVLSANRITVGARGQGL